MYTLISLDSLPHLFSFYLINVIFYLILHSALYSLYTGFIISNSCITQCISTVTFYWISGLLSTRDLPYGPCFGLISARIFSK
jgi:hypothetical protein